MTLFCVVGNACGDAKAATGNGEDEGDTDTESDSEGILCLQFLDHDGYPMEDCESDYRPDLDLLGEEAYEPQCDDGQILVVDAPGEQVIDAQCGTVKGFAEFELNDGDNGTLEKRLEGSLCWKNTALDVPNEPFYTNTQEPLVQIQYNLMFSSEQFCDQKMTEPQLMNSEVFAIMLDCSDESMDCKASDGSNYASPMAPYPGIGNNDGDHLHYIIETYPNKVPEGEEVRLNLVVIYNGDDNSTQQIMIPVVVEGPTASYKPPRFPRAG